MRHSRRRSQEEIENSFNPINLDYIFNEDDPLSQWIEERENPLLDGVQNAEWLPRDDSDDDIEGDGDNSENSNGDNTHNGDGGLSPPSDDDGGDNGEGNNEESTDNFDEDRQQDPYQDVPYGIRNQGFVIDMSSIPIRDRSERSGEETSQHESQSRRRQRIDISGDSSYSNISQSLSNFSIDDSTQSTQGYPPFYHQPYYQPPSYYQLPPYYQPPPMEQHQSSGQFFNYIFGQGIIMLIIHSFIVIIVLLLTLKFLSYNRTYR